MTKYDEYRICKVRGHETNGYSPRLKGELRTECKHCGTLYGTKYFYCPGNPTVQKTYEENVPEKPVDKEAKFHKDEFVPTATETYNPNIKVYCKKCGKFLIVVGGKSFPCQYCDQDLKPVNMTNNSPCVVCGRLIFVIKGELKINNVCEDCKQGDQIEQIRKRYTPIGGWGVTKYKSVNADIHTLLREINRLKSHIEKLDTQVLADTLTANLDKVADDSESNLIHGDIWQDEEEENRK